MRSVSKAPTPRTATVRSGGRTKTVRPRTAASSSGSRGKKRKDAPPPGLVQRFTARVIRNPMLSLGAFLLLIAGFGGLIAGGHISGAFNAVGNTYDRVIAASGVAVGRVTLEGQSRTPPNDIYVAAGIHEGDSMLSVHPSDVRAKLMALPWVHDAAVKRVYPDTVAITVIEKLPFALWKHDGEVSVVERSGAPITTADPVEFKNLPTLVGDGAPKAAATLLDAIGATRAISSRIKLIERVSNRRWNLILDGPVAVKLPEEGWEREIGTLERLIVENGVLEKDIEIIDLRFADRYIFQLRNGDSRESPRERPI